MEEQAAPASGAGRNLKRRIVVAKYNYKGSGHGDITFNKADQMEIVDELSDWYVARHNGTGKLDTFLRNLRRSCLP